MLLESLFVLTAKFPVKMYVNGVHSFHFIIILFAHIIVVMGEGWRRKEDGIRGGWSKAAGRAGFVYHVFLLNYLIY